MCSGLSPRLQRPYEADSPHLSQLMFPRLTEVHHLASYIISIGKHKVKGSSGTSMRFKKKTPIYSIPLRSGGVVFANRLERRVLSSILARSEDKLFVLGQGFAELNSLALLMLV